MNKKKRMLISLLLSIILGALNPVSVFAMDGIIHIHNDVCTDIAFSETEAIMYRIEACKCGVTLQTINISYEWATPISIGCWAGVINWYDEYQVQYMNFTLKCPACGYTDGPLRTTVITRKYCPHHDRYY